MVCRRQRPDVYKRQSIGMSKEGALSKYGIIPDIGIKFKVDKVFVQTPGPDAGKEIGE